MASQQQRSSPSSNRQNQCLGSTWRQSFFTIGWVGADRTLRRDICVIPGGQRWKWTQDKIEPCQETYYPISRLPRQRERGLTQPAIKQLAEELGRTCGNLALHYGELRCPLTSGRDTRFLASLLINGGIKAKYYTSGDPDSPDVRIGTQIAQTFNLSHETNVVTTKKVIEEWEAASSRLTRQNDGMVSLWQIADVLEQPLYVDHLSLSLWGIGGEIARGFYSEPHLFLHRYGTERMQHWLAEKFVRDHGGLIRGTATELARTYLQRFVGQLVDQGFPLLDVPTAFYSFERVRRWAGSNGRKSRSVSDRFSPFCTRPFVEAAFRLPALYRCSEPLHYEVIRLLLPELHRLPFGKGPWRSQQPFMNIVRIAAERQIRRARSGIRNRIFRHRPRRLKQEVEFDHAAWLEAKCSWLRELCLDQSDSLLWDFVDRSTFERITSNTADVAARRGRIVGLYNTATLFHYALT